MDLVTHSEIVDSVEIREELHHFHEVFSQTLTDLQFRLQYNTSRQMIYLTESYNKLTDLNTHTLFPTEKD